MTDYFSKPKADPINDIDAEASSPHHTLGKGPNQAASGNHGHGLWADYVPVLVNVPYTTTWGRKLEVDKTVRIRAVVNLTGAVTGSASITLPYDYGPTVAGVFNSIVLPIGAIVGLRQGVSWFTGNIIAFSSVPPRASFNLQNGNPWNAGAPAAWASGDVWGFDLTYERV